MNQSLRQKSPLSEILMLCFIPYDAECISQKRGLSFTMHTTRSFTINCATNSSVQLHMSYNNFICSFFFFFFIITQTHDMSGDGWKVPPSFLNHFNLGSLPFYCRFQWSYHCNYIKRSRPSTNLVYFTCSVRASPDIISPHFLSHLFSILKSSRLHFFCLFIFVFFFFSFVLRSFFDYRYHNLFLTLTALLIPSVLFTYIIHHVSQEPYVN